MELLQELSVRRGPEPDHAVHTGPRDPGFGGQKFIPTTLDKIREVRALIDASGRDIRLEVDGGIGPGNIAEVAAAGADTFVAGSAIFGQPDYSAAISSMRQALTGL